MEVRREGGKGFQDRAGNAEVRDRLREWDKESSRALQQLGQIVWIRILPNVISMTPALT